MNKLIVTVIATLFAANLAFAQAPAAPAKTEDKPAAATPAAPAAPAAAAASGDCEAQAIGKNGKPLYGAAKNAFMKKCTGAKGGVMPVRGGPVANSNCEAQAVNKDGKPLRGAAKSTFMKKCMAAAK